MRGEKSTHVVGSIPERGKLLKAIFLLRLVSTAVFAEWPPFYFVERPESSSRSSVLHGMFALEMGCLLFKSRSILVPLNQAGGGLKPPGEYSSATKLVVSRWVGGEVRPFSDSPYLLSFWAYWFVGLWLDASNSLLPWRMWDVAWNTLARGQISCSTSIDFV